MDILTQWKQNGVKKIKINKRYSTYLVHQNYHQNLEKQLDVNGEREREREIYG